MAVISSPEVLAVALSTVANFGTPNMYGEDGGAIILYATGVNMDDVFTRSFGKRDMDALISFAADRGMDLSYEPRFYDEWTNSTFTAIVIH